MYLIFDHIGLKCNRKKTKQKVVYDEFRSNGPVGYLTNKVYWFHNHRVSILQNTFVFKC